MRLLAWGVLIALGVAVVAVAGFLGYLNWAFSPRGAPREKPSAVRTVTRTGVLGEGLFYAISELRESGSADVIHDVTLSRSEAEAKRNEGSTVLRSVNAPVPRAVRRVEARQVVIEFENAPPVPIALGEHGEPPNGWVYLGK